MGHLSEEASIGPVAFTWELPWGVVVRGQRWGAEPAQLLLVHEPGTDLDAWRDLPAYLAQRLRVGVATVDLPGHGLSDDPWERERLADVLRSLLGRTDPQLRQVIVAAGQTAGAALGIATQFPRLALVCLSPEPPRHATVPIRSPQAPKLFFAAALAGEELNVARKLANACGGWSSVNSLPVSTTGTGFLASRWRELMYEGVTSFARDFLLSADRAAGLTLAVSRDADDTGAATKDRTGSQPNHQQLAE
jgi:pimeloyl-ACP methyl ester carboxylesterase